MAEKSFNRTVEAINDLLDKLDNLPDYPLVFKGGLNNPSYLPSEATQGDLYLVMYANNDNTGLANSLYYRTHTNQWEIIANISYTKAQIDDKLDNIADNAELSTYTAGAGTSFETVANTDTVTDAIEKVQNNALLNKNNILYNTNNGVKNLYDYANSDLAYKASSCTATKSANGISVSSSGTWAFASYPMNLKSGTYKLVCTVSDLVIKGGQVRITIGTNAQATGEALTTFGVSSNGEKISDEFTIQSDSTVYLTLYINQSNQNKSNSMLVSNIMIIPSNINDTSYQPYALSNAELTSKALRKQTILQANDDFNSATLNGMYKFNGGPANNPAGSSGAYGILLVITFDNYTMQLCYDFVNGIYYRNNVSSWSAWTKFN